MSTRSSTSDIKKDKVEYNNDSAKTENNETGGRAYDSVFERKTLRYVDFRILPVLALVYSFGLMDRMNLAAAYTAGMDVDLHLREGGRYSIANSMYFLPYVILQLPLNTVVLRRLGVRNWLSFIVLAWGSVQLGVGFVDSWGLLVLLRVLLGAFQASFFPALVFIVSTWYTRHEVQKRFAAFYLLSIFVAGFGNLLAYVLSLLDGKGNLAGWKWIFIIEGLITISLAVVTYFYVPDFPHKNRFLTKEQTDFILQRIDEDRSDALPDEITWAKAKLHLKDWTIWAYGVLYLTTGLPFYAQAFFLPIILKGMGWSKTASLLLSVPPVGPAIITTMIIAYYADKLKHRSSFIAGSTFVCTVGLSITAFAKENQVRYFGAFLTNIGSSGTVPCVMALSSNNVVSHSKRAVTTAVTLSLSSVGGVIASTVFRAADYPRYIPGLAAAIGCQVLTLVVLAVLTRHFYVQNKLSREGKLSQPLQNTPGFLYTL